MQTKYVIRQKIKMLEKEQDHYEKLMTQADDIDKFEEASIDYEKITNEIATLKWVLDEK